jgi:hypothetical protein
MSLLKFQFSQTHISDWKHVEILIYFVLITYSAISLTCYFNNI